MERIIIKRVQRIDGAAKVTGEGPHRGYHHRASCMGCRATHGVAHPLPNLESKPARRRFMVRVLTEEIY